MFKGLDMDRAEMLGTIAAAELEGLSTTSIWSYGCISGRWTDGEELVVTGTPHNGSGGCRPYRGIQIASGIATTTITVSHDKDDPVVVKAAETFAAAWDGGSFGNIISRSMSCGYYLLLIGTTADNLQLAKDYLVALKRRASLYSISGKSVNLPSDRDYYPNDRWQAFNSCSYRWELMDRTSVPEGILELRQDGHLLTVYHVDRHTEVFSPALLPKRESWLLEQQLKDALLNTGIYAHHSSTRAWIGHHIYGEPMPDIETPGVVGQYWPNPKDAGTLSALLRTLKNQSL